MLRTAHTRVLLTTAAVLLADGFSTSGDRRASTTPRSRESPGRGRKSQPLGLRPPWATADAAAAGVTATAEKPVLTITSLQHLGEEELRSRDASAPLLIVKYYSKSCRACAAIAPKYRSLARDLGASASCFEMESKQFKVREPRSRAVLATIARARARREKVGRDGQRAAMRACACAVLPLSRRPTTAHPSPRSLGARDHAPPRRAVPLSRLARRRRNRAPRSTGDGGPARHHEARHGVHIRIGCLNHSRVTAARDR